MCDRSPATTAISANGDAIAIATGTATAATRVDYSIITTTAVIIYSTNC